MIDDKMDKRLQLIAATVRKDVVRMIGLARAGYVASSLSIVDILTVLYWCEMEIFPEDPHCPSRDRFVLGKGHGCPALYAVLAHRGFFGREELWNYCKLGAMLQGNPESGRTPGVDSSSGSCGTAPGIAAGMALSLKREKNPPRVYCLIGDGELQEGSTWESILLAAHFCLDNLVLIVDRNHFQMDGTVESIMSIEPLEAKFSSFGWKVFHSDGHDVISFSDSLLKAGENNNSPSVILSETRLGKGVSFIEEAMNKGNSIILSREKIDLALKEISRAAGKVEGIYNAE